MSFLPIWIYFFNKYCWEPCKFHYRTRILYAVLDNISSLLGNIEECFIVMKDKVICFKHLAQRKCSENIHYFSPLESIFWPLANISCFFGHLGLFVCFFFLFSLKLSYITHSASLASPAKWTAKWATFPYVLWFLFSSKKIWSLSFYFILFYLGETLTNLI